ncbi:fibronectin type III domain-containing protein [Amnibacterium sp. CER49]|uniref:fibronectin type III domain-containing protein n=1 Tax=Amnibacterium sp. CER49 TaxID=3039161 RepID=UPI00244BCF6D|nr:fibronectin type III domain-containing protein [Amnibacterium sp. CER49]MDH2444562.1 fibronectin type III domain-containing protein [Amnibacterium sp. CER49]
MNKGLRALAMLAAVLLPAGIATPAVAAPLPSGAAPSDAAHHGTGAVLRPGTAPTAAARPMVQTALPASVDLTAWAPPVGDQGVLGSCTSWAVGWTMAGWYARKAGVALDFAPMYLYSQVHLAATSDGGGQYTSDVYRVAAEQGIDLADDYLQGAYDFQHGPTAAERASASRYRLAPEVVLYAGTTAPGAAAKPAIEAQLAAGHPVHLAFPVYRAFEALDATDSTLGEADVSGQQVLGGHSVVALGYDATGVTIQNSWGTEWGAAGRAKLDWSFVEAESQEATTTTGFVTGVGAQPVPTAPTALGVRRGVHAVTLTWQAPTSTGGSAITGYTVTAGSTSVPLAASARSYTVTGLVAGRPTAVTVRAVTANGAGAAVVRTVAAATAPLWGGTVRVTSSATAHAVTLHWSAVGSTGGMPVQWYTVHRSGTDTSGRLMPVTRTSAATRTFTFAGLVKGQRYTVSIRAVNAAGTSAPVLLSVG